MEKQNFGPSEGPQGNTDPSMGLTFGEKVVELRFNPSNDDSVNRAKRLCAALADLVKHEYTSRGGDGLSAVLFDHTIGEILNAQMNAVKFLTIKY